MTVAMRKMLFCVCVHENTAEIRGFMMIPYCIDIYSIWAKQKKMLF